MWNSDLVVNLVRLNKGVRFGCDGLHVALLHSATSGENKHSKISKIINAQVFYFKNGFNLLLTVKL